MTAEQWNAMYPVGTPVLAYPGIRPEHALAIAYQKRATDGRLFGDKDPCKRLVLPVEQRIAFALFDPGAIVPRGNNYQEPIHHWQARAITYVLPEGAAS